MDSIIEQIKANKVPHHDSYTDPRDNIYLFVETIKLMDDPDMIKKFVDYFSEINDKTFTIRFEFFMFSLEEVQPYLEAIIKACQFSFHLFIDDLTRYANCGIDLIPVLDSIYDHRIYFFDRYINKKDYLSIINKIQIEEISQEDRDQYINNLGPEYKDLDLVKEQMDSWDFNDQKAIKMRNYLYRKMVEDAYQSEAECNYLIDGEFDLDNLPLPPELDYELAFQLIKSIDTEKYDRDLVINEKLYKDLCQRMADEQGKPLSRKQKQIIEDTVKSEAFYAMGYLFAISTIEQKIKILKSKFPKEFGDLPEYSDLHLFRCLGPVNFGLKDHGCNEIGGCRMLHCTEYETPTFDLMGEYDIFETYTMNDWFIGYCMKCKKKIPSREQALRIPLEEDGWEGCFCSEHNGRCARSMIRPGSIQDEKFDSVLVQLNLYGIYRRN